MPYPATPECHLAIDRLHEIVGEIRCWVEHDNPPKGVVAEMIVLFLGLRRQCTPPGDPDVMLSILSNDPAIEILDREMANMGEPTLNSTIVSGDEEAIADLLYTLTAHIRGQEQTMSQFFSNGYGDISDIPPAGRQPSSLATDYRERARSRLKERGRNHAKR